MSEEQLILPVIDSHIHLWQDQDEKTSNWWKPNTGLDGPHYVQQFKQAAKSSPSLLGYISVETNVVYDLDTGADGDGWEQPLKEVARMKRLALGQTGEGDLFNHDDAALCLAIIPWAPVSSGAEVLEKYIDKAKEVAGDEAWAKVKGFRYLVQDKPHGTMLDEKFIDGLKLLGRKGLVFEVGVDHHRRGKKQLEELVAMIDMAHEGVPDQERVTFIINHLCKPDLSICNIHSDPNFHAWRTAIYTLAKCPNTYMKLSGGLSEMPESLRAQSPSEIFQATWGWWGTILATFGAGRVMFGSDWPICTVAGQQQQQEGSASSSDDGSDAWAKWMEIIQKMCWMASMPDDERAMIFGGTAKKAYGL